VRALALLVLAVVPAQEKPRPNVLLIYTDDQSYRTLSCYEGAWPWVRTPNIDRIAAEGVRFTHMYGAAWCTPSRASLLTGLLPHGIKGLDVPKVVGGGSYDPAVCRFWPAELRRAGYHTAIVGKWHLGKDRGHGRDWDHSAIWDQDAPRGDWYNDQAMIVDGGPSRPVPGYSTDVFSRFAVDYVRRSGEKPWFLWLSTNAPHMPNTVHPRHQDRYAGAEVPVPGDVFGPVLRRARRRRARAPRRRPLVDLAPAGEMEVHPDARGRRDRGALRPREGPFGVGEPRARPVRPGDPGRVPGLLGRGA
jgi:arylsulfatase A-like enzyme